MDEFLTRLRIWIDKMRATGWPDSETLDRLYNDWGR